MALAFGPYFVVTAMSSGGGEPPVVRSLVWLAAAAATPVLLLVVGQWYVRSRAPLDARTPPDERDRAIDRRSVALAYYVLIGGMIVVGVVMPFDAGGWSIINAALFVIIVAEVVHYACTVTSYRLQS